MNVLKTNMTVPKAINLTQLSPCTPFNAKSSSLIPKKSPNDLHIVLKQGSDLGVETDKGSHIDEAFDLAD